MDKAEPGESLRSISPFPFPNEPRGNGMTFTPIGIDIAKATFDAAALCHGKCKTKVFGNTPEGFTA